jgi:hypothetical protein
MPYVRFRTGLRVANKMQNSSIGELFQPFLPRKARQCWSFVLCANSAVIPAKAGIQSIL